MYILEFINMGETYTKIFWRYSGLSIQQTADTIADRYDATLYQWYEV